MRRRAFLLGLGGVLTPPFAAETQSVGKVHRLGVVSATSPDIPWVDAFRLGLREHGYIEGRNISIEQRFTAGHPERFPDLIAEMIRLKVDVLVVASLPGAVAAKTATTTIPVVFLGVADPVSQGIVASLARPGRNVTGLSLAIGEGFAAKWVELLKEAVPSALHIAALWSSSVRTGRVRANEMQNAAKVLGVKLELFDVHKPEQFDSVFTAISASHARALIVTADPLFSANLPRFVEFAARSRLPTMYFFREYVEAGGLMAYGPSFSDSWHRAAVYVDKILKGAKPGDLPVEQPTKFELVINLKTAKALGLAIPQSLLVRADQVIE